MPKIELDVIENPFDLSIDELEKLVLEAVGDDEAVEKQLLIDEASKENLVQIRKEIFYDDVDTLAEQLYTGEVSIGQWEESMKRLVREMHTSAAAIGKGSWEDMTPADWGRLGPVLKNQYRYLHGFAEHVADNRDTISLRAIQARAHLYGNAAGHVGALMEAGDVISRRLPWIPKDGTTQCLVGCKCLWITEIVGEEGDFNIVQFTWRLRPAEHCEDCLERNGHVEVLRLHKSIPIPATIGGY